MGRRQSPQQGQGPPPPRHSRPKKRSRDLELLVFFKFGPSPVDTGLRTRPASMVPRAIPLGVPEKDSPSMHRRSREFKAESFELEGRLLLANAHALILGPAYVEFQGTSIPTTPPTTTTRATPATTTTPTTTPTQTTPTTTPTQTTPTLTPPTTSPIQTTTTAAPTQVVGQQDGVATVVVDA